MQTLDTIKARSQTGFANLMEKAKEPPSEVKTWGATAGGAVVGALALRALAGGIVAVVAALATPPVAMTVGAVGGGLLGWNYMRNRQSAPPPFTPPPSAASVAVKSPLSAEATFDEIVEVAGTTTATYAHPSVAFAPNVDESLVLPEKMAVVADYATGAPSTEHLAATPNDKLEVIHGIGPVYAGRLRAAGVQTFADLAALSPARVREIIGPSQYGQTLDAESWIAEALQLMTPRTE